MEYGCSGNKLQLNISEMVGHFKRYVWEFPRGGHSKKFKFMYGHYIMLIPSLPIEEVKCIDCCDCPWTFCQNIITWSLFVSGLALLVDDKPTPLWTMQIIPRIIRQLGEKFTGISLSLLNI